MSLSGFTAPWWFTLVVAIGLLVAGYLWVQRRRRRDTLRFTNLELLEKVAPRRNGWYRHAPAALLGVALLLLTVSLAGPTTRERVPRNRAVVMMAIDVSLSMKATDVQPTRLAAAQAAAKSFVEGLTPGVNLGLVAFAGTATVLVSPTTDRESVKQAIDDLRLAESTATGDAIVACLRTIESFGKLLGGADGAPPARIVLMTDGKEMTGTTSSSVAAKDAAKAKVPISSISFGTDRGTVDIDGRMVPVPVDDDAMKEIADLSGGEFHKAATAEQLRKVYDTLGEQIGYENKQVDASRPWLVLGTLSALIAVGASLALGRRIP
ncbi:VWA domain-containing protein [Streptoalloteichus tenebrarius]|uniref:VWA domain-containing protein n=1 Tax=Streptoalloteichus tenebrarius (strain ATCC 17920 / DSM 40477 / JCM 4838 / CBS 697.72 / NBRC 16177 / NCIMB 11028 / NRRL B-12390 / A12253. 1 / ISP 5477) TaxID=1933 RepID=UPI0020A2488A|nr:VWA domain-containing protein [Streptoalloteichus tenebrarius]